MTRPVRKIRTLALRLILAVLAAALAGCGGEAPATGDPDQVAHPRVVTFAPHITDIAFDMGIGEHVVAVSRYCILPPGERRPRVGDAFNVSAEAILAVEPDVIFFNTRPGDYEAVRRLKPSVKLVRMENRTLAELREGIERMGQAVGAPDKALALLGRIDEQLDAVQQSVAGRSRPSVLLVLGTEHPSTVGPGWLTSELIEIAGGRNVAAEAALAGWSKINLETIARLQPDVLICQVGPGRAERQAAGDYWRRFDQLRAVRDGRVYVTSDPRLTIPGSGVGQTARRLAAMIHPDTAAEGQTPPREALGTYPSAPEGDAR